MPPSWFFLLFLSLFIGACKPFTFKVMVDSFFHFILYGYLLLLLLLLLLPIVPLAFLTILVW